MTVLHQRTLIRRQVVTILKAANTLAGTSVWPNRATPVWIKELPALCVYTLDDDPDIENEAPRSLMHNLDLVVEAVVRGIDGVDETLDSLCAQVENAMMVDDSIGGTVVNCILGKTTTTVTQDGSDQNLSAKISFKTTYRSDWPEESVMAGALVTLDGVDTQITATDGAGGTPEIDTTVNLPDS